MIRRVLTCVNEQEDRTSLPTVKTTGIQRRQFLLLVLSIAVGSTAPRSAF